MSSQRRRVHGVIAAPLRSEANPAPLALLACSVGESERGKISTTHCRKYILWKRVDAPQGVGYFFDGNFPKEIVYPVLPISPTSCSPLSFPNFKGYEFGAFLCSHFHLQCAEEYDIIVIHNRRGAKRNSEFPIFLLSTVSNSTRLYRRTYGK